MKFITVSFDYGKSDLYKRLIDVFEYSAKKECPEAEIVPLRIPAPELDSRTAGVESNTYKLAEWVRELRESAEGEQVILIDCDMVVTGNLFEAFKFDFDIAYTYREVSRLPINGGVIFTRVNEKSIAWFEEMKAINDRMYHDRAFHKHWRSIYAGINQAAMGYLIENYPEDKINIAALPCQEWNCANPEWKGFNNDTKVIHIKGILRRACLQDFPYNFSMGRCLDIWKKYETELKQSRGE